MRRKPEEVREKAKELYVQGENVVTIALKLDITKGALYRWLRLDGVPRDRAKKECAWGYMRRNVGKQG